MSLSTPQAKEKPLLFFSAFPGDGHVGPLLTIASYMIKHGYDAAFMCSQSFKDKITRAGVEFLEMPEPFGPDYPQFSPKFTSLPPGVYQVGAQVEHAFFATMPIRAQKAMEALETLRKRDPKRQIIVVEDILNMSTFPLRYGSPLPKGFDHAPKRIGISPLPLFVDSQDTAPIMMQLPPDSTESGRLRNKALLLLANQGPMKSALETRTKALSACQCTVVSPEGGLLHANYTNYDFTFMLCSPSLEYPLSDMPNTIHFAGCLPRRNIDNFDYPDWWPEIVGNTAVKGDKKKILFVSQGTVFRDFNVLLIPALQAFSGRDDVLVIATLGLRGDKLPEHIEIPGNVRVIDYIPYDLILEHTDVFIANGGYGSLVHTVMNGVPAVLAGQTEEKPEVIMRAVLAGLALGLQSPPTPDQVREGVEKVLGDPRYKKRAMELRKENEEMDSLRRIEQKIVEFTE